MNTPSIDSLNTEFAIPDHISFKSGPGDLTIAEISNSHATATVALLGAHVMSYQPKGHGPVLWMSKHSHVEVGRPIRGGIPVCWPWFAVHPTDSSLPNHGFVRTALWSVLATDALPNGATQIRLGISDTDATRCLWPHAFELEIRVTVGPRLTVDLIVRNKDAQAFTWAGALHSYFNVSNAADITIHGLDGCTYIDTVGSPARKVQQGPVTVSEETDRIYTDTEAECVIDDPGLKRRIHVAKEGSRSTVVWNPWTDKSKRMEDFGDDEYPGMVCVETAKAEEDGETVPAGGEHRLTAVISVEGSG